MWPWDLLRATVVSRKSGRKLCPRCRFYSCVGVGVTSIQGFMSLSPVRGSRCLRFGAVEMPQGKYVPGPLGLALGGGGRILHWSIFWWPSRACSDSGFFFVPKPFVLIKCRELPITTRKTGKAGRSDRPAPGPAGPPRRAASCEPHQANPQRQRREKALGAFQRKNI